MLVNVNPFRFITPFALLLGVLGESCIHTWSVPVPSSPYLLCRVQRLHVTCAGVGAALHLAGERVRLLLLLHSGIYA